MPALAKEFIDIGKAVPRYTSYPAATQFVRSVDSSTYGTWLEELRPSASLSLYLHVPFCEKICLYCGCNTKAVRRQQPIGDYFELLEREIELVADRTGSRQVVHLHWGGGTPSIIGPERLRSLAGLLQDRFDLGPLSEHAFELDPRHVTNDLAAALRAIGVTRASLGVQDLSAHVQQAIGRIQPFPVVERAVMTLRDAGIRNINIDLMYGLPDQSLQDIRRTINLVHRLKPQRLAVFGYAHVPWFKKHQRLLDESALPSAQTRIAQFAAAHEELVALGYDPIGIDHFANSSDSLAIGAGRKTLRRNFQGYTTDAADALIGLGASAISHFPQGFAQNLPDIPGYSRAIMSGTFATARGLKLGAMDRIRARIIEEIMCHLACDLGAVLDHFGETTAPFDRELEKVRDFARAGLVTMAGKRIVVEERGRPYLRLIASIFDEYLVKSAAMHSVAV